MTVRWLLRLLLLLCCSHTALAAPQLAVPDGELGLAGERTHPGMLLNLSLTFVDAGAAYRDNYRRNVEYDGYFDPRMCYSYPMARRSASVLLPDLSDDAGYFSIVAPADSGHECGGATFSGNFLNWASMSTLDLLRLALTGGDRIVDRPGLTVLQRAWLPDGAFHPDFYASTDYFPRKSVSADDGGSAPSKVTPFDSPTLYVVSCRNRLLLAPGAKGHACDAPRFGAGGRRLVSDKYFGEFNARVAVCGPADSRRTLCRAYGTDAKPEGAIQRYSADMRTGLMSYLTEHGADDANLYGGVLRAPLKFVGARRFAGPDYAASPNPQAEWQATNGVLLANPDGAPGPVSGTINYINQLGRAQPGRMGAYKSADPGAELFYEGLRYLQNRAPSVTEGAAADAGFPVWKTRADPIMSSCQRVAIATIGHTGFIDDRYLPGNTRVGKPDAPRAADSYSASAKFDVMQAARAIGAMEADPAGRYGNRKRRADLFGLDTMDDGAGSYYLAASAYRAHTSSIRPDKPPRVDSYALELGAPARAASSALYLAAKYGAFDDRNGDGNPFITSAGRPPDSEWSADGATPAGWFGAPAGADVAPAVQGLFAAAAASRAAASPRTVMATRGGAMAFVIQSSYDPAGWSGRLERLSASVNRRGELEIGAVPVWESGQLLNALAPSARKIFTMVERADWSTASVPFTWAGLPAEARGWLDSVPGGGMRDGLGEARLAYLRGDRSREAGKGGGRSSGAGGGSGIFRRRTGILGDSMTSTPLLVGAPSASVQGPGYARFYERNKARANAVYVGANDGMLHAFDTETGAELFAYVPQALLPVIGELSSPTYRHRPYVDASAGYGEASLGGHWSSVLVSGMGMGARGVFALDVTNPAAFASGKGALWEFTERDDSAMGHVRSPPLIAKIKVGTKDKVPVYRHFAVVASGINNYGEDDAHADPAGALFLLALDKPPRERWKLGVNYYRLAAPAAEPGLSNALGPPALAVAADGSARFAYSGDLQGRLWRFDLDAARTSSGAVLFEARDSAALRQPITHAPKVVFAPGGGYLVLFATGKLIESADLQASSFAPQSMYAIHDSGATPIAPVRSRSQLAARTASAGASATITGAEFDYGGAVKGWYVDFPNARGDGERAAGSPALAAGTLFVNTVIPGADPCAGPASRTYVLDSLSGFSFTPDGYAISGRRTGDIVRGRTDPVPLIFDLFASVGQADPTGGARAVRTIGLLRWRADGAPPLLTQVKVGLPAKRISWREVANWRDLHAAARKTR